MPQGYGYGNARLRAQRSRLLTEADYHTLLAKPDIEEVITFLAETPYHDDIDTALIRVGPARCVFEAVRLNLTRSINQLHNFYDDQGRTLISVLLRRWDRHNLLAILRGQSQEASTSRILAAVVPVGQLDAVALRELARQPGLRATIDLMTSWRLPYARPLRQVQARHGAVPDLDQLELALNQFHYQTLLEAVGSGNGNRQLVRDYLRTEIDLINLRTTLKSVRISGLSALVKQRYGAAGLHPLLLEPGGFLSTQQLAALVTETSSVEDVVHGLSNTRYGPALQAGWQRYQAEGGSFTMIERELERWQAKTAAAMFVRSPLGIGVPIGYLSHKETEAANLRLVANAVLLELDREFIKEELIIL